MATVFNHLADRGMVDSLDGPAAEEMRAMANRTELTNRQLKKVVDIAGSQAALHGDVLRQEAERRRSRSLFTAFVLADIVDPMAGAREVDELYPLPDDHILEVAQAAVDVVNLLAWQVRIEPAPAAQ